MARIVEITAGYFSARLPYSRFLPSAKYLARSCGHLAWSSVRLFNVRSFFAFAISKRSRLHRLQPYALRIDAVLRTIFHMILYSMFLPFSSQINFDSSVDFLLLSDINEFLCCPYRVLNVFPDDPM